MVFVFSFSFHIHFFFFCVNPLQQRKSYEMGHFNQQRTIITFEIIPSYFPHYAFNKVFTFKLYGSHRIQYLNYVCFENNLQCFGLYSDNSNCTIAQFIKVRELYNFSKHIAFANIFNESTLFGTTIVRICKPVNFCFIFYHFCSLFELEIF